MGTTSSRGTVEWGATLNRRKARNRGRKEAVTFLASLVSLCPFISLVLSFPVFHIDVVAYHRRRLLPRFVEKGEKKPLRLCGTSSSCTKAFLLFPFFLSPPPRGVPSLPPQARAGSVSSSPEVVTAVAKGGRCKGRKETSCLRSVPPSFTVFSSTSCPLVLVRLFQP